MLDKLQRLAFGDEEVQVFQGAVGRELCRASVKMGVGLIAVGAEQHTALGEFLFGHPLLEIMAGAPYPHHFIAYFAKSREDREFTIRFAQCFETFTNWR